MQITQIERQKHNPNRYSIYIDGAFAFGLDGADVLYHKLQPGQELPEQTYQTIRDEVVYTAARDKALRFLGYKARTRFEVEQKLTSLETDAETVQKIINMLEKYGYLDDARYARAYIEERVRKKNEGLRRVLYVLSQKGVAQEVALRAAEDFKAGTPERGDSDDSNGRDGGPGDEYAQDMPEDAELTAAVRAALKRCRIKNTRDENEYRRSIAYLTRRGFDYETAQKALQSVWDGPEDIE